MEGPKPSRTAPDRAGPQPEVPSLRTSERRPHCQFNSSSSKLGDRGTWATEPVIQIAGINTTTLDAFGAMLARVLRSEHHHFQVTS